jgi:hypothetical protein
VAPTLKIVINWAAKNFGPSGLKTMRQEAGEVPRPSIEKRGVADMELRQREEAEILEGGSVSGPSRRSGTAKRIDKRIGAT